MLFCPPLLLLDPIKANKPQEDKLSVKSNANKMDASFMVFLPNINYLVNLRASEKE
jgi:hypothetical protein